MSNFASLYSQPLFDVAAVRDQSGDTVAALVAAPDSSVLVRRTGESTAAPLYADRAMTTALANPIPTGVAPGTPGLDVNGNLSFWAPAGDEDGSITYEMVVTRGAEVAGPFSIGTLPPDLGDVGAGVSTPDATTAAKGKVRLAGDLAGTADAPTVPGLGDKLAKSANLSDLASATSARLNLGLGTAATQPTGAFEAAGTAVKKAGDTMTGALVLSGDPVVDLGAATRQFVLANAGATPDATSATKGKLRLTGDLGGTADSPTVPGLAGKLAKADNLSDLASAATARTNLGLGTAATRPATDFAALVASQTFVGTQTLRPATAGAAQLSLLDSAGAVVGQVRGLAGDNLGIGANAVDAITSGTSNIGIGSNALGAATAGYFNVAIGLNALSAATLGFQNTAIGVNALQNSTGNPGSLPGTTGTNNTAVGANAGQQLTSGHRNTAVGVDALFLETTGIRNTAVGVHALNSQVGVDESTAVGFYALFANVSGLNNVAVGSQSLGAVVSTHNNTAMGFQALAAATTSNNTAVGSQAGLTLTTGSDVTAVGALALTYPAGVLANRTITGGFQTAVGALTGQGSPTQRTYTVALGYSARYDADLATALGAMSQANHGSSVALGYGSVTTAADQVMVGSRDVETIDATKGFVGRSANGKRWRATFGNDGAITTTEI